MSPSLLVVTGASGAGKTTVGQALARMLGWAFQDADDLHTQANLLKMAAGHALDDADRSPWLARLSDWVSARLAAGQTGVLACSLLRRAYRDQVVGGDARIALIYLRADAAVLRQRMECRAGHFMPPSLLGSQLATLEPPMEDEACIIVDAAGSADQAAGAVLAALDAQAAGSIRRLPRRPTAHSAG